MSKPWNKVEYKEGDIVSYNYLNETIEGVVVPLDLAQAYHDWAMEFGWNKDSDELVFAVFTHGSDWRIVNKDMYNNVIAPFEEYEGQYSRCGFIIEEKLIL